MKYFAPITDLFAESKSDTKEHVNQRNSKLHYLYNRVINLGHEMDHAALIEELESRSQYDALFKDIFPDQEIELNEELKDYDCYRFLINTFEDSCGKFSEYGFQNHRGSTKMGQNCQAIM